MQPNEEGISDEFRENVDRLQEQLVRYDELTPENRALYDFIAAVCAEEEDEET